MATRLRADLPTPAEAGFAKAGALQRAATGTWRQENFTVSRYHPISVSLFKVHVKIDNFKKN